MRRRDFLALVGASAAWPMTAAAQGSPPRPRGQPLRIGALIAATKEQSDIDTLGPFLQGMVALGYVEGRDFTIGARYYAGDNTLAPGLAADVVALKPDLILSSGDAGALSLHQLTQTIPIVAQIGVAATVNELVGSLARPAGNVTGMTSDADPLVAKHCDLALEIVPTAARIGVLAVSPSRNADRAKATRDAVEAAATVRKFTPVIVEVAALTDIAAAFHSLADQQVQVAVVGSGLFANDRALTVQGATAVGLPTVYNEQGYVEFGGLLSYGFDRKATFVRLATFADLILRGARPSDIPFEQASFYYMAVNLKTAKSLGLTIPPSVLFRADLVIE